MQLSEMHGSLRVNTIKRFDLWYDFPKSVVNSRIIKPLNTPSGTKY